MRCVLAVDGGNTKTLAVVATDDSRVVGVARGGCSDIYGAGSAEAGCDVLVATVRQALDRAAIRPDALDAGAFSLAGADWPEDLRLLETVVVERLGVRSPLVVNDAIGGLRCGAPDWVGLAVVCGTFNAVGARNADGQVFHLGFWPDRTGAFDLSAEALKAVYREGLGLGPPTALTARALAMYGADDPLDLLHFFTRRGNPGIAERVRMTPVLLDVADGGDVVARTIVDDAGRMLGDEAAVAAMRVGLPIDGALVVLSGGVLAHPTSLLVDAIMDRLVGARPVRTRVPPIVGALLLAMDRAGFAGDAEQLTDEIAAWMTPAA